MKLVVSPPAMMTIRMGSPDQWETVPCSTALDPIGPPASIAKAMKALMMPAKAAIITPFEKLNSLMVFFFS